MENWATTTRAVAPVAAFEGKGIQQCRRAANSDSPVVMAHLTDGQDGTVLAHLVHDLIYPFHCSTRTGRHRTTIDTDFLAASKRRLLLLCSRSLLAVSSNADGYGVGPSGGAETGGKKVRSLRYPFHCETPRWVPPLSLAGEPQDGVR